MMKNNADIFLTVILIALLSVSMQAQLKRGHKLLKQNKFDAAIEAFEADIFNEKADIAVEAEYNIAQIYFTTKYEGYSLENAYEFAKSALNRQQKLNKEEMLRIQKKKLGKLTIDNFRRKILNAAYDSARIKDSYAAYEHFLLNFDGPTAVQADKIMKQRNLRGLEEAMKTDSWNAYENFYKKHRESLQKLSPELDSTTQVLMFEAYMRETNWNGYSMFSYNYPDNIYVKDWKSAEAFIKIAQSNSLEDFKNYIKAYPKSPYRRPAIDFIAKLTLNGNDIEAYDYFVRNFNEYPKIKEFWKQYFEVFLKEFGTEAEFKKMYPAAPLK
jgi:hypothetical protein